MMSYEIALANVVAFVGMCKWCGADYKCDCVDRMTCKLAQEPGHTQCGTYTCGCPAFWAKKHTCPPKLVVGVLGPSDGRLARQRY